MKTTTNTTTPRNPSTTLAALEARLEQALTYELEFAREKASLQDQKLRLKADLCQLREDFFHLNHIHLRNAEAATGSEGKSRHGALCLAHGAAADRVNAILTKHFPCDEEPTVMGQTPA